MIDWWHNTRDSFSRAGDRPPSRPRLPIGTGPRAVTGLQRASQPYFTGPSKVTNTTLIRTHWGHLDYSNTPNLTFLQLAFRNAIISNESNRGKMGCIRSPTGDILAKNILIYPRL